MCRKRFLNIFYLIGGNIMKKYIFKTVLLSMSFLALGSVFIPTGAAFASENISNSDISVNADYSDNEYYYVLDEPVIQPRTWSQAQSWSIQKGSRTYLGTETHSRKTTLGISTNIYGMNIKLGYEYSASGKFKKYRQNARITVTYRVYRKVDNRYVRTQTSTANTQYIDYVAI